MFGVASGTMMMLVMVKKQPNRIRTDRTATTCFMTPLPFSVDGLVEKFVEFYKMSTYTMRPTASKMTKSGFGILAYYNSLRDKLFLV